MDYKEFIDTVLSDVGSDERIKNGMINLRNPEHLDVLREYVVSYTDDEFADVLFDEMIKVVQKYRHLTEDIEDEIHNWKLYGVIDEGNYPERQAYNENGVLVTFPDSESKKAAIERGTHFESPPEKPSSEDKPKTDDEEDESTENVFSTTETPEQKREREKKAFDLSPTGTDITADDIRLRSNIDSSESSKERHRLYDILRTIKTSKDDGSAGDINVDEESFELDKLHPSVLFALSEKWVFDKSGDWYNEDGRYRGNTDLRGQVNPSRPQDKEKMEMWIEDHKKRKSGISVSDEKDL